MIKYLAGPLIGMVIGYCTNYIAVRMLFRPRTEKRLFGKRIPLTPGAIPKGQPRLAKAAGEVVATYLVTEDDIGSRLLSGETENAAVDKAMAGLSESLRGDLRKAAGSDDRYMELYDNLNDLVTEKIVEALQGMDLAGFISREGSRIVQEKVSGTMMAMFLNEKTVSSLTETLGSEVNRIVDERGDELIRPVVRRKIDETMEQSAVALAGKAGLEEEKLREIVTEIYRSAVSAGVSKMIRKIDIAGMIEEKINAMSPEELERLVMSVMKKELRTIINLGALIGLILGSLNILI